MNIYVYLKNSVKKAQKIGEKTMPVHSKAHFGDFSCYFNNILNIHIYYRCTAGGTLYGGNHEMR